MYVFCDCISILFKHILSCTSIVTYSITLLLEILTERTFFLFFKCCVSIKAASTPVQSLMFQAEYMRLRCEMLTCMAQLVATCNSFCTAPPPAIAAAIVQATRDDLQRFGHITNQVFINLFIFNLYSYKYEHMSVLCLSDLTVVKYNLIKKIYLNFKKTVEKINFKKIFICMRYSLHCCFGGINNNSPYIYLYLLNCPVSFLPLHVPHNFT